MSNIIWLKTAELNKSADYSSYVLLLVTKWYIMSQNH